MANDVPITTPYRDYRITAPKRGFGDLTAEFSGWARYLEQETGDYILQENGDKIMVELGVKSPKLKAPYRDYNLTGPQRQ